MSLFDMFELSMQLLLRNFSSGLMIPVLIVLIGLAVYTIWVVVSVIIECLMQRRHFKENVPQFVDSIEAAPFDKVEDIIENSQMLIPHKDALIIVADRMSAQPADLYALAKREVGLVSERYQRITARTDMASKIAPMFGLMGTLIPLGPGIVAMGQGNTEVLASSLLVAFDTTVAGLITSAICMVVSKIRKSWYQKYLGALEASMTAILEKAEEYREGKAPAAQPQESSAALPEASAESDASAAGESSPALPVQEPQPQQAEPVAVIPAPAPEPEPEPVARFAALEPQVPAWYENAKQNAHSSSYEQEAYSTGDGQEAINAGFPAPEPVYSTYEQTAAEYGADEQAASEYVAEAPAEAGYAYEAVVAGYAYEEAPQAQAGYEPAQAGYEPSAAAYAPAGYGFSAAYYAAAEYAPAEYAAAAAGYEPAELQQQPAELQQQTQEPAQQQSEEYPQSQQQDEDPAIAALLYAIGGSR